MPTMLLGGTHGPSMNSSCSSSSVGVPPLGGILGKFRLKPGLQPMTALLNHYTTSVACGDKSR